MKSIHASIRVTAAAIAAVAAMALPAISHAGSVTLNNTIPVCVDTPTLSMTPAGDLSIICTAATTTGGAPTVVPSCTVNSPTITVGSGTTLSAACTGAPTSYAWTAGAAANTPAVTGTGAAISPGPFTVPGTFSYSVIATNNIGPSPAASGTVTVNAASTGGVPNCPATAAATGSFTVNNQFTPLPIHQGTYASAPLPPAFYTAGAVGHAFYFSSVQASGTQNYLPSQYSISQCPGDFTSTPECTWTGYAETFNKGVAIGTARSPGGICTIVGGSQQYFVNVRQTLQDGVTPTCVTPTCTLNIFTTFAN